MTQEIQTKNGLMNQGQAIKAKVMELLEVGFDNKQDIYNEIEKSMGVPRSTIRRICREVRLDLMKKIAALQNEAPKNAK